MIKFSNNKNNKLELVNVQIKNVYWNMNSMLDVSDKGSDILLENSKFENIRICGSIVKPSIRKKYFEVDEAAFLSDEQKLFVSKTWEVQKKILD